MTKAPACLCPNCGAPVNPADRHCGFCRGPIATVRCGHCYHMNAPTALHCMGCGHDLGLEPLGRPGAVACPDCEVALEVFRGGPGRLRDCGTCGGQFVEHALLRDLIERREIYGSLAPRRAVRQNPFTQPVRYRPCPGCGHLMNRRNFGGSSGVIVDICHQHGIWFDAGELPRVLAFVESGGLAQARRRELEEIERKKRDAQNRAKHPLLIASPSRAALAEPESSVFADIAQAAVGLLDALMEALSAR